ncbi:MAG TPA: hypothetical protein VFQ42_03270 [Mycobacterium sp.]|nr:hypothetical protein [Mycobacterium sp.]
MHDGRAGNNMTTMDERAIATTVDASYLAAQGVGLVYKQKQLAKA